MRRSITSDDEKRERGRERELCDGARASTLRLGIFSGPLRFIAVRERGRGGGRRGQDGRKSMETERTQLAWNKRLSMNSCADR